MPSDTPSGHTLFALLSRPLDAYRSALAVTIEQLRGQLADVVAEADASTTSRGFELGAFGADRIDLDRFAAVATRESVAMAPAAVDRMQKARDTLQSLLARGENLLRVTVDPGGDPVASVSKALGEIGRAFGAARAVALSRSGAWSDDEHAPMLDAFGFDRWNAAERGLAPPLVVTVDGGDLGTVEGLAAFLDGATKLVLLVEGDAPPAPLARLITPGVFVAQVEDAEKGLERLGAWDGPGVVAVVPQGAALFTHDPGGGATIRDRLKADSVPEGMPEKAVGRLSVFQQAEPLRQLRSLLSTPAAGLVSGEVNGDGQAAAQPVDPVGKLAAWLLSETDLTGIE